MPPLNVLIHVSAATLALVLVAALLMRRKGGPCHKMCGRFGSAAMLATAITSLWVPRFGVFSFLHLFTVMTLVSVPYAIWAIRAGRLRAHRLAMMGTSTGLFGAAAGALAPGRLIGNLLFG